MKTLFGIKQNMSQVFTKDGNVVPVTYIDVEGIVVAHKKTEEKDGYNAYVLGKGKKAKPTKAEIGKYKELGFVPQISIEAVIDGIDLKIGDKVTAAIFEGATKVDVTGTTKGKGFQGVVKRWGFHGGPRTHGQSDRQRHPGSIGMRTTPGRVFKGKKMGGHMGADTQTTKNLKVIILNNESNLIAVKGAIPGPSGSLVIIKNLER
jgi:large subunit ribosomal protein L3